MKKELYRKWSNKINKELSNRIATEDLQKIFNSIYEPIIDRVSIAMNHRLNSIGEEVSISANRINELKEKYKFASQKRDGLKKLLANSIDLKNKNPKDEKICESIKIISGMYMKQKEFIRGLEYTLIREHERYRELNLLLDLERKIQN